MRILFTDDDAAIRELAFKVLDDTQAGGHVVALAVDGQDAIIRLDLYVDVLITDNQMPRMNGPDLIRYVRENYPNIRTILISGDENLPELAKACGADAWVKKPVRWDTIKKILSDWEKEKSSG